MKINNSIVGRLVSFFHPNHEDKMILVKGVVTKHLGDGILLHNYQKPFWFADMFALRKH